uniref:Venom allergen-like (VAL) 8 protein n=1 Tax=Schistosoma mansoni TaxID=6183 RepID=A0A3Q0KKM1_SCHMA
MKFKQILYIFLLSIYIKVKIVFTQPKDAQLRKLLQYHNELRRNLTACKLEGQPPAKNLPDLKWDNELASKAKDLANECYFHHNDVDLPEKWQYIGQNIAGYQTIEQAFDAWKDEYKQYNYYSKSCSGVCGHYTQLVWQNTTHVGCGITNCTGSYSFPYGLSVVCNYGPGGNYEGRYPYEAKSQDECYATTTKRPSTTTTKRPGTTPTQKPGVPKQIPKPIWPSIISTWNEYATSNMIQGIVTQTCICVK